MGDLNGEFETSEFFVTCLKELELRRGEAVSGTARVEAMELGSGEGWGVLRGDVAPSRLLMLSGDHPLADELIMLLRDAPEGVVGCRRNRVPGEGAAMDPVWWAVRGVVGDAMLCGAGVSEMEGGLSMVSAIAKGAKRQVPESQGGVQDRFQERTCMSRGGTRSTGCGGCLFILRTKSSNYPSQMVVPSCYYRMW